MLSQVQLNLRRRFRDLLGSLLILVLWGVQLPATIINGEL